MDNKSYISSRTSYGKIQKLDDIEAHNQRLMEVKTLLIDKINAHNDNLQDKDKYFREITDYEIMQNLSYSFGSNETQNLTQSFNEFYQEMEAIYKKKKQHLYKDRGNHIIEQVVSLSHFKAKEILGYEDGDRLLLEYFKEMAIAVQKEYGFEPIHIDMHLDEGYIKNIKNSMGVVEGSEVVENIHAHIVFLNYNFSKQKTVLRSLKKQDFRDMQDLSADIFQDLGFVRGEDKRNSNKTHLKTTAYVEEQQNIENEKYVANQVNFNIEDMEYNLDDLKIIQENEVDVINELIELKEVKKNYDNIEELKSRESSFNTTISEYEKIIQDLKDSKKDITALSISNEEKKKLHKLKQVEIKKYQGLRRNLKSEIKSLNTEYKSKLEKLKTLNESIIDREKSLKIIEDKKQRLKYVESLNKKQLKKEHYKLFLPILTRLKDTPTFNKEIFIKEQIKPLLYEVLEDATETKFTLNDIEHLENDKKELEQNHLIEIQDIQSKNEQSKKLLQSAYSKEVLTIKSVKDKIIKGLMSEITNLKNRIKDAYNQYHNEKFKRLKEKAEHTEVLKEKNNEITNLLSANSNLEIDLTTEKEKSLKLETDNTDLKSKVDLVDKYHPHLISELLLICSKCGNTPCSCTKNIGVSLNLMRNQ